MSAYFDVEGTTGTANTVAPPNPGSQAAREQGCKCPVMDNAHGRGIPLNGKTEFYISLSCPLHSKQIDMASLSGSGTRGPA